MGRPPVVFSLLAAGAAALCSPVSGGLWTSSSDSSSNQTAARDQTIYNQTAASRMNCERAAPAADAHITTCTTRGDGLMICTARCEDGYEPRQGARATYLCNEHGQWTGGNLECSLPGTKIRKPCPTLGHCAEGRCLGAGSHSTFVQGCNASQPGVVCEAECKPGYETTDESGREEWECDEAGIWHANRPLCQGVLCRGSPEPNADSCEGQFEGVVNTCSARCTRGAVSAGIMYTCGRDPHNSNMGIWQPLGNRLVCHGREKQRSHRGQHDWTAMLVVVSCVAALMIAMAATLHRRRSQQGKQACPLQPGCIGLREVPSPSLTDNLLDAEAAIRPHGVAFKGASTVAANEAAHGSAPLVQQKPLFVGFDTSGEAKAEDIELLGFIAKGASGSVFSCRWNGMRCAVKRFAPCGPGDQELAQSFHKEVFLLRNLQHENLVRCYAACTLPEQQAIITELMVASLDSLLYGQNKAKLPDTKWHDRRKFQVLNDIISGVAFLHSKHVSHRDLKSMNVLYDANLRIKLCDFGLSTFKAHPSVQFESRVGTPAWMAPELLNGLQYSAMAADVWSLGVIVWEMVNREQPWKGVNPFAIAVQVGGNGKRLDTSTVTGTWWCELMAACWTEELDRPTITEVVSAMAALKHDLVCGKAIVDGAGLPWGCSSLSS
jgi:tRNA A-37 threonylcarbamoyl transferase component Bud32